MAGVSMPRAALRRARLERRWSQERAAEALHQLAARLGEGRDLGVDGNTVSRWERGTVGIGPRYARLLCLLYDRPPHALDLTDGERVAGVSTLASLEIDPEDVPSPQDVEAATMRLRRSYSTTAPDQLLRRVNVRLRQVRRLLSGPGRSPGRRTVQEAAAWLALLRATVLADLRQYEAAETSVRVARELAREIGHAEVEAWTWETAAWIAATDGRLCDARDLAGRGIEIGPVGGHGLVAATLQRARVSGTMGDREAAVSDLAAGRRALAAAGAVIYPDDHYSVDPAKAAFFASGMWAQLRRPAETIEHASEVVRASEDPQTRNFWPMRVANARVEWAMALTELGDEDAAAAMAARALDPQWMRPDTERRTRLLLARMRDHRLRTHLASQLHESLLASAAVWDPG
jgi:transcriptional regulator with XRE-family HTH domain